VPGNVEFAGLGYLQTELSGRIIVLLKHFQWIGGISCLIRGGHSGK
jgi:hypothetical protein